MSGGQREKNNERERDRGEKDRYTIKQTTGQQKT